MIFFFPLLSNNRLIENHLFSSSYIFFFIYNEFHYRYQIIQNYRNLKQNASYIFGSGEESLEEGAT